MGAVDDAYLDDLRARAESMNGTTALPSGDTGDPVFDGSLEQALTIGLESAPFITAYRRDTAASLAAKLQADAEGLDVEA